MLCNRPAPRVERGGQKFCWYIGRKSLVRGSTNKSGVKKLGEMSERSKKLVRGAKNLVRGSTGPNWPKPFWLEALAGLPHLPSFHELTDAYNEKYLYFLMKVLWSGAPFQFNLILKESSPWPAKLNLLPCFCSKTLQSIIIIIYFSLNWIMKNICCCLFKSLFKLSTHFFTSFSKTAGIPTDSCENSTAAEMGFNSYPNIKQKWNWFQIILSEIYELPKKWKPRCVFLNFRFPTGLNP